MVNLINSHLTLLRLRDFLILLLYSHILSWVLWEKEKKGTQRTKGSGSLPYHSCPVDHVARIMSLYAVYWAVIKKNKKVSWSAFVLLNSFLKYAQRKIFILEATNSKTCNQERGKRNEERRTWSWCKCLNYYE